MALSAVVLAQETLPIISRTPYLLEGLSPVRRTVKVLAESGVERALLLVKTTGDEKTVIEHLERTGDIEVHVTAKRRAAAEIIAAWLEAGDRLLLTPCDMVFDPRLIRFLVSMARGSALLTGPSSGTGRCNDCRLLMALVALEDGQWLIREVSNGMIEWEAMAQRLGRKPTVARVKVEDMRRYNPAMRREVAPYHLWLRGAGCVPLARRILVKSAGKGASDALAYYVHKHLEDAIVERLVPTKITPNMLTALTNVVAWTVTGLYLLGRIPLGLILAFAVGVIDGLDGKLARAKFLTSKTGRLEHSLDMLYEYSWVVALSISFSSGLKEALPLLLAAGIILNVSFYRSCYDQFRSAMGRSLDDYGSFERAFRRVAGRRNLYNIHILFWLIVGRVRMSLLTILVHSGITSVVYFWRAVKHMRASDLQGPTVRPVAAGV